ncbi:hypothetical protein [Arthrobacter sp. UYCu723]
MQYLHPRAAGGIHRAQRAITVIILALATLLAPGAGAAWPYSTGPGSGTGSSALGTLQPPTNVIVPATSTGKVHLSWTAATGTPKPTGYYVRHPHADKRRLHRGSLRHQQNRHHDRPLMR